MFASIAQYWTYVVEAIAIVAGVAGATHAIMTKSDVRSALGWTALVLLAPIVGALLYAVFGVNRIRIERKLRRRRAASERLFSGEGAPKPAESAPVPANLVALKRLGDAVSEYPLKNGNRIEMLETEAECHAAMLGSIDAAKRWIFIETYIFNDDIIGRKFVAHLAAAMARGVGVRVLIDAIGSRYSRPPIAESLAQAGLVHAHYMGRLLGPRLPYANLRTHRKLMIVDGESCFVGGMNIRAAPSAAMLGGPTYHDTHFRVAGPAVEDFLHVFASDWLFASGERLPDSAMAPNSDADDSGVPARVVASGPDRQIRGNHGVVMGALSLASRRVVVATPYFLPDRQLVGALAVAVRRGVQVDIVLPLRSNLRLVDYAVMAHLEEVDEIGCRVWQTGERFDHSKLLAVDGQWAFVGSSNFDPRSFRLNFEVDLEIYDFAIASRIEARSDRRIAEATRLRASDLRALPFWKKLRNRTCWLASPFL